MEKMNMWSMRNSTLGAQRRMLNPGQAFRLPRIQEMGPTWLGFEQGQLVWQGRVMGSGAHATNRPEAWNYVLPGTTFQLTLQQMDNTWRTDAPHDGMYTLQLHVPGGPLQWTGTYQWIPSANGQDAIMWLHDLGPYPYRLTVLGQMPGVSYSYSHLGRWLLERV